MITKGHDFLIMTLVVVLNADQGLFSTDFRAAERLAQTIVQVAGPRRRGSRAGEVLIQTSYPEHPLLQTLLREGYDGLRAHRAGGTRGFRLATLQSPRRMQRLGYHRRGRAGISDRVAAPGRLLACRQTGWGRFRPPWARRAGRFHSQLLLESADRGGLASAAGRLARHDRPTAGRPAGALGRWMWIRSICSERMVSLGFPPAEVPLL